MAWPGELVQLSLGAQIGDEQASADRHEQPLEELDRQHEPFAAPFQGFSLTPDGFTEPAIAPLNIVHFCDPDMLGICGQLYRDEQTLLFARQAPDGSLTVTVGPCGKWAQQYVDPSDLEDLAACAQGRCPTSP